MVHNLCADAQDWKAGEDLMRRFASISMAGALALVVSASLSGIAGAQGYTGNVTSLSLSTSTVPEGGTFEASGTTDTPNTTVGFVLTSHPQNLGSTTSNASGAFRATLTVPCGTEQGAHTLTASGGGASRSASLNVSGATGACAGDGAGRTGAGGAGRAGGAALPRTGTASTAPLTAAGLGLVVLGAIAVAAARRRRSAQAIES